MRSTIATFAALAVMMGVRRPGGQGAFDVSGSLAPGLYRINSAIALSAGPEEDSIGTYPYQFAVPEPASLSIFAPGLLSLWRRRCGRSGYNA